jgi:hypothetical protein
MLNVGSKTKIVLLGIAAWRLARQQYSLVTRSLILTSAAKIRKKSGHLPLSRYSRKRLGEAKQVEVKQGEEGWAQSREDLGTK